MTAIPYRWTGKVMEPERLQLCKFVPGNTYWLEKDRSEDSHKHHFAWLRQAWKNLPEDFADQFPSPEHLRKAALIQAGFYDETIIDCESREVAHRVAAYARGEDDFAHIVARGALVVIRKAKSQSRKKMSPADFQASKDAVREIVAHMIGVAPESLERNAELAA
jgi:hypothetical protein